MKDTPNEALLDSLRQQRNRVTKRLFHIEKRLDHVELLLLKLIPAVKKSPAKKKATRVAKVLRPTKTKKVSAAHAKKSVKKATAKNKRKKK